MKLKDAPSVSASLYYNEVRGHLRDLPHDAREGLLQELDERLRDLPPGVEPFEVLGSSSEYATLVRDAAGFAVEKRSPLAYWRATRRRTKVLVRVTIVLVAAVIAGSVYVAHYQPVRPLDLVTNTDVPEITQPISTNQTIYKYVPGAIVKVGATLENRGPVTATITGAGYPVHPEAYPFSIVEMRATHDLMLEGSPDQIPAVSRISVPPHQQVVVWAVLKIRSVTTCVGCGESDVRLPNLDLEVLGVHHTVPIGSSRLGLLNPQ